MVPRPSDIKPHPRRLAPSKTPSPASRRPAPLKAPTPARAHSVTMSALASWTAMLRGSCCSWSRACWSAPRFRNRQTWLQAEEMSRGWGWGVRSGHSPPSPGEQAGHQGTHPVRPRSVAWCRGARPRLSLWFTSAPFCRRNSQMIKEPWGAGKARLSPGGGCQEGPGHPCRTGDRGPSRVSSRGLGTSHRRRSSLAPVSSARPPPCSPPARPAPAASCPRPPSRPS